MTTLNKSIDDIYSYKCKHYEEYEKSCRKYSMTGNLCPALEHSLISFLTLTSNNRGPCRNGLIKVDWIKRLTKRNILNEHYEYII